MADGNSLKNHYSRFQSGNSIGSKMRELHEHGTAVYAAVKKSGLVLYREPEHAHAIKQLFENDAVEFIEIS